MKIFGWKSVGRALLRPARAAVPLARGFGGLSLGEWPRSYEAQVREGYLNNAVAQRAVRLVAEGAASVPITASDPAAHMLLTATTGGQSLMETLACQLLLHGNGYVQMLVAADGMCCELFALRPERVSIEADVHGWPAAFRYKAGDVAVRLATSDVIHIRTHHPLDDHYGLGCLGAASGAIAIHNASSRWNKALLDNAARPSGALVHDGAEALSSEQFDRLKSELAQSFSGTDNAGRPMLLEGGLKWQSLSLSPADMDFAGMKAAAAREIALAFGVPPMLLGLPGDATYANYREANKALWRQAILPLSGKILGAIAEGLSPWFPDLKLSIDMDQVAALSEDRERLWAQVAGADFLTPDEKRVAIGLVPLDGGGEGAEVRKVELKFNPWHDTQDGKFTRAGQGQRFGDGGASGSWEAPKPREGGTFGGGGASGSWSKPELNKPPPKVQTPKIEKIDTPEPSQAPVKPKPKPKVERKPPHRTISAGGYKFEADSRDRTVRAYGQLRLEPEQPRSRSAQSNAGKPDRLPDDHGGHFIAREFGGPETRYNHFAQNARFNVSGYRKLESEWKKALKSGNTVIVSIRAYYRGESKRPTRIRVSYYVAGERQSRSFPNTNEGN